MYQPPPQQPQWQPQYYPPQPPPRRKTWPIVLAVVAVLVVVVVGGVIAGLAFLGRTTKPDAVGAEPQRVVSVTQTADGKPVSFGGVPIYDPCGLLPVADIAAFGYHLDPKNTIVDDQLERPFPAGAPPRGLRPIHCSYGLTEGTANIQIYPTQVPMRDQAGFADEIADPVGNQPATGVRRFTSHGLSVTTMTRDSGSKDAEREGLLTNGKDLAVQLVVFSGDAGHIDDLMTKSVDRVAAHMSQPPAGNMSYGYAGAYFSVADPCSVVTHDDLMSFYPGIDANFVNRSVIAGEDFYYDSRTGELRQFVEDSCGRGGVPDSENISQQGISISYKAFRTEDMAVHDFAALTDPNSGMSSASGPGAVIGHAGSGDVIYYKGFSDTGDVMFRVGRYEVSLHSAELTPRTATGPAGKQLAALAVTIAPRLAK